jgi:hypothetical protein
LDGGALMEQQPRKAAVIVVVVLLVIVLRGFSREGVEIRSRLPRLRSKRSADHPIRGAFPSTGEVEVMHYV